MPSLSAPTKSSSTPSKKRATIMRVLKEARRAFSDKGLAGARVEDIAKAAGVTKQLIYHYFNSKEQLFSSVLYESAQDVLAELLALELDHLPPTEALQIFLEYAFDQYQLDPALGSLAQESLSFHEHNAVQRNYFSDLAPELVAQMDRILQRGVLSGDFRSGIDPRLFYAASALLTTGGFTNRYTVSAVAGFDSTSPEGIAVWREFSVNFVLSVVLLGPSLPLERPASTSTSSA